MHEKPMGGGKKKKTTIFKLIISILFLNNIYSADTTKKTGIDINNIIIENQFRHEYMGITLQKIRIKYNNKDFTIKTKFDQPKSDKFGVAKNARDKQYDCDLPIEIYYNVDTHPDKEQTLNDVKNRLSDIIKDEVLDFKKLIKNFPDSTLLIYFRYDDNYSDIYNIKNNTYCSVNQFHDYWINLYTLWQLYKNDEKIKNERIPSDPTGHFIHPLYIHIILWDQKPEDKPKIQDKTENNDKNNDNYIDKLNFIQIPREFAQVKTKTIKIYQEKRKPFKIKTKFNQISSEKCPGHNKCRNGQWDRDLPFEIFYNEATHDGEQTLNNIKTRLSDIIKDKELNFDKLKKNFPDSNLLIYFNECNVVDIFDIRNNTYSDFGKLSDDYQIADLYVSTDMYKRQEIKESIPDKFKEDHFNDPQAIHIILCDEKKEKNKPHKNNTKSGIKNKGDEGDKSNKHNDFRIPNKSQGKNNKKNKKNINPTPNGTSKSNQCCKCCGCCSCCKQKT